MSASRICSEKLGAFHVGTKGGDAYEHEDWLEVKYEWWAERWPGFSSPRDLAGGRLWDHQSCNANTIGIEVVPPFDDAAEAWSPACWATLRNLVLDITSRHGIPMKREYVVTHSDAHPVARTNDKGNPWDPGVRQWAGWPSSWTVVAPEPAAVG
ncbi:MAG: N-acetylmuramoyl-L-alanine amidase [Myxococcales bacterium]